MDNEVEAKSYVVDLNNLPAMFPTHRHSPLFWEKLGRTVATFGFLEEVLGKAIFAFTGTIQYDESQITAAALESWLQTLEHALTDSLGNLIDAYGKAVRNHPAATVENLDGLLNDLREASKIRNVLCHGSWQSPDNDGRSVPFFVTTKKMVFVTPVDMAFLDQTQRSVAELACVVASTVTHMGWQFPGSKGPGKVVF